MHGYTKEVLKEGLSIAQEKLGALEKDYKEVEGGWEPC